MGQSLDNSTDTNTSAALGNNATTVIYAVDENVAGVINSEAIHHRHCKSAKLITLIQPQHSDIKTSTRVACRMSFKFLSQDECRVSQMSFCSVKSIFSTF